MGFLLVLVGFALAACSAFVALLIWLWRKGAVGKVVGVLLFGGVASQIYLAIYPPESFYRAEFERISGLPFPSSGIFLFKDASYPDFHGDYTSCALVSISLEQYEQLKVQMKASRASLGEVGSECIAKLEGRFPGRTALVASSADKEGGEYSYWALVADKHEVIIHYVSW